MDESRAAALSETLGELRGVSRAGAAERAEMAGLLAARKIAAREHTTKGAAERKSAASGKRLVKPKAQPLVWNPNLDPVLDPVPNPDPDPDPDPNPNPNP